MADTPRDTMIAALAELEAALASAYARYWEAYRAVSRAAYPADAHGNRQVALEAAIGGDRVHGLLVQRLRALGFGPVLTRARTTGTCTAAWVTALTSTIRAVLLPEPTRTGDA